MRIIGIDPGLRVTGFGVIDVQGSRLAYVTSGVIRTPSAELSVRLGTIFDGVSTLVREYRPDQSAIEKVFVNVNPQSTLLLGQAAARRSAAWWRAAWRWPSTRPPS